MANITPQYDLTKIKDPADFVRFGSQVVSQLITALNGNLDFTNLKTQTVEVTFSSINTNTPIAHNLGKTGVNYFIVSKNAASDVYRGTGDTLKTVVLQATVATTMTIILF